MTALEAAPRRRPIRRRETSGHASGRRPLLAVAARLAPPPLRAGTVSRQRLLQQIRAERARSIIAVFAPPGYGKTTLLAQWATDERRHGRVAWLRLNELDNDPDTLVADLAMALDPVPSADWLPAADAAPRIEDLADRLERRHGPAIVVLDDVHRVVSRESLQLLQTLLDHRSAGVRIALAGRAEPDLPLARYRAEGRLADIPAGALALDEAEAAALVHAAGCRLDPADLRTLVARTEGWAAAMYLAVLALGDGRDAASRVARVSGADPYIAGYLRSEFERELSPDDVTVLLRTAILDSVSGDAADAVSAVPGASRRLRALARENQLLVALEPSGQHLRYHALLRDYLLSELDRREPGSNARAQRAAAEWFLAIGEPDRAVHHADASGDPRLAARVVAAAGAVCAGDTVDRWLSRFDRAAFEAYPPLAVAAAWRHLLAGRRQPADDMADIAEQTTGRHEASDGSASFASQRARLRAVMARHGAGAVLDDAQAVVSEEGSASPWRSSALWLLGEAYLLVGERATGLAALRDAIGISAGRDPLANPVARARLAMATLDDGDWGEADALMRGCRADLVRQGYEANPGAVMVFAADARIAILCGDIQRAGDDLNRANAIWPRTNHTMPWLAVDALLHLVQANLSMSETRTAQAVLRHAEQILRQRPDLGSSTARLRGVRAQVADACATLVGGSALTPAELRVVSYLPTHLSFQEIADRLTISRNTVKTHAMSIYGKLWVSSRDEAVRRGVELGLLEPHPVLAGTASRAAASDTADALGTRPSRSRTEPVMEVVA